MQREVEEQVCERVFMCRSGERVREGQRERTEKRRDGYFSRRQKDQRDREGRESQGQRVATLLSPSLVAREKRTSRESWRPLFFLSVAAADADNHPSVFTLIHQATWHSLSPSLQVAFLVLYLCLEHRSRFGRRTGEKGSALIHSKGG